MKFFIFFTFIIFSLSFHLAQGGIFRRYVRKHRPGHRLSHQNMIMSRSRMINPPLLERQFSVRQRPWPMFVRRARAPPLIYHYPLQYPIMLQTAQPVVRSRASRRYRFTDRLDNSRVPQFHHQPVSGRHHHPIGISSTTRIPTTTAVQWSRPLDYGNPIDRDPTYDYAPPAIERVRFVTEVRPGGRQPTARANTGMIGMYSRPSPVVVPAPWKRDPNIRARHPSTIAAPHHFPPPPPPRGALPLWKILAHKQRPRRPQRPGRPQQQQTQLQPVRFIGQDPNHPLYHHQAYQLHHSREEAEVYPHIPNIVYFKPADVSKTSYAKKTPPLAQTTSKKPSSYSGTLKPGRVTDASLYSKEVSSSSEFRPVMRPAGAVSKKNKPAHQTGNKGYQFTVVGYSGPAAAATTPMSPVALPPSTSSTKRPPTVLYAIKTTPETLSTTHNSVVKPLEPTESLEPEEEAASELRPVHVLPDSNTLLSQSEQNDVPEVEDGREQGGVEADFDNVDEVEQGQEQPAPVPVVPNSFNIFDSLIAPLFEKEKDVSSPEEDKEDEVIEVKHTHHHHPIFEPAEESTLRGALLPAEITTPRSSAFETITRVSVSSSSSSHKSSKFQPPISIKEDEDDDDSFSFKRPSASSSHKSSGPKFVPSIQIEEPEEEEDDDMDGLFANIRTVPTTTTTSTTTSTTTTTTTTERPVTSTTSKPTTTAKSTTTSTAYPRLPTMPTYKRKTPVYAKKISKAGGLLSKYSSPSSGTLSKDVSATGGAVPNGSGEVVIITAGRSKVKEYKPQVIANQTHLLAFDKVVSQADGGLKESPIILSSVDASPSTSTTKSPLEDFDAMQLLHSWLNKA